MIDAPQPTRLSTSGTGPLTPEVATSLANRLSTLESRRDRIEADVVRKRHPVWAMIGVGGALGFGYLAVHLIGFWYGHGGVWTGLSADQVTTYVSLAFLAGGVFGPMIYIFVRSFKAEMDRSSLSRLEADIRRVKSEAAEAETSANPASHAAFRISKQLDEYTTQARDQTRSSFGLASMTFMFSFVLVILGALAALTGKSVQPGVVAAVAGLLGQFLSAIIMRLHTQSLEEMHRYHERLAQTQWIGIALGVVDRLPADQQTAARHRLLEQLSEFGAGGHAPRKARAPRQSRPVD